MLFLGLHSLNPHKRIASGNHQGHSVGPWTPRLLSEGLRPFGAFRNVGLFCAPSHYNFPSLAKFCMVPPLTYVGQDVRHVFWMLLKGVARQFLLK